MKRNDIKSLLEKDSKELLQSVKEAKKELFSFVLDHAQNKLKNTSQIANKKKDIARMLTKLKEFELKGVNK